MSLERSTPQHTLSPPAPNNHNHEPPIDSPKGWTNDLPRVLVGNDSVIVRVVYIEERCGTDTIVRT